MHLRQRSIRARTFFLVLVPLLALLGLYTFATTITAGDAITLARATAARDSIADPVGFFTTEIQGERMLATVYLAAPTPQDLAALGQQEGKSDAALAALRRAANSASMTSASSPAVKAAVAATLHDAAGLPALRGKITSGQVSRAAVQSAYSAMVAAGLNTIVETILQMPDVPLVNQSLAVMRITRAVDILLQSEALLVGDDEARYFPPADHAEFARLVGEYQGLLAEAMPDLSPAYRSSFQHAVSPQAMAKLHAAEDEVINSPAGAVPRVQLASYDTASRAVAGGLALAEFHAGATLASSLHQAARPIDLRLILAGGLGLLAILVSIIVSASIGRGLVRQLAELRQGALELANQRLPRVIGRLSAGDEVDVEVEAPPMATSPDEIGQVRQAFNSVQRSAIEAAVSQARLRAGISTVFRNLARRNQSLLHQQLSLLDSLERRAAEPAELEGLFRIDHLTTRMRRHAEGLVVLAGDQPGRTWTEPVPMADVLRGAVAEVVDYARIRVVCTSRAALAGRVVADAIHLIAELAENGTMFSAPESPVRIVGSQAIRGFAVEIEDRGLGMSEEMMAGFNAAFLDPPPLDLAESEQLGLYVAARLAHRHDIRITLRASPFGGTTAIVLIPIDLIVEDKDARTRGGGASPSGGHPSALTGRHASRAPGPEPRVPGAPADLAQSTNGHGPAQVDEWSGAGTQATSVSGPWELPGWVSRSGAGLRDGRPEQPETGGSLTELVLPRRIRHTNLAPQLREPPPDAADSNGGPAAERSPDEMRDALSAMQRGWERGRDDDDTGAGQPETGAGSEGGRPGQDDAGNQTAGPDQLPQQQLPQQQPPLGQPPTGGGGKTGPST
jgi:signal transduction histidine kinase